MSRFLTFIHRKMVYFCDNLVFLRKFNKISQEALAEKVGVKRTTISNYESGFSRPDFETLIQIANFFDIDIGVLLTIRLSEKNYPMEDSSTSKKHDPNNAELMRLQKELKAISKRLLNIEKSNSQR